MNELALFAGAGGGILGGKLLGWTTVAAVEIEPFAREILLQRQRDGMLDEFPIWDDVRTFDGRPWRGLVDIVSGGFPCQDISAAGRGAGIDGERSGLWREMFRIICEIRPRFAFLENSPLLTARGLGRVLGDLAAAGYDAEWGVLSAAAVGAPHERERIWIVAALPIPDADLQRAGRRSACQGEAAKMGDPAGERLEKSNAERRNMPPSTRNPSFLDIARRGKSSHARSKTNAWWASEPGICRVVDGLADRMDRLKAIGNGQVPLVAATAFTMLKNRLEACDNA